MEQKVLKTRRKAYEPKHPHFFQRNACLLVPFGAPAAGTKWSRKCFEPLKTKYNLEGFKLTIFEFRGLIESTAENTCRDIGLFLGVFDFDDIAGNDLSKLMVSIHKDGFIKKLIFSDTWQAKPTYIVSLKVSLKHFVEYLENEERVNRAHGSTTTALGNIPKAVDYDLSTLVRTQKAKCRTMKTVKDAILVEEWVGSDGKWFLKSLEALRHTHEHEHDGGFFSKVVHQ